MAVLPMKRITICALKSDRKAVLEDLQRKGVIEIADNMKENKIFRHDDYTEAVTAFAKNIQTAKNALDVLETYAPEKKSLLSSLEGRSIVGVEKYTEFDVKRDITNKYCKKLVKLSKIILESRAEKLKLEAQIEALSPWAALDIPTGFSGTKRTSVFIGTLPGVWTDEAVYTMLAGVTPVDVDIISTMKDQTCIYVMATKECSDAAYETLRSNGFARPALSGKLPPAQQQQEYENKLAELDNTIRDSISNIENLAQHRESIKFYIDYETMRQEKYGVINRLLQSRHAFVLTGFIAERDVAALKQSLESRYDIYIEESDPKKKDKVPVILSNNGFARPLESVTEGYSLPGKKEIDPTMPMALFYYLLFGIMFSDAGYGLILIVATTIVLAKFKNMEESMKRFCRMFQFCGVSTLFWGIVFSSYFGNVVDIVSETFFGTQVSIDPLWFSPLDDPMRMLVFSMVLGLVHLFAGLIMKFVQCAKQKKYFDGFCDGILWILFVGSLVLLLMSMQTFMDIINVDFILEGAIVTIATAVMALSAIGILLTAGRESKSIGKRLMKGAYGLYGITSYLSDVLSYSRLLALGLATGVIASVINQMGAMPGSGVSKVIIFTLVFIVGHLLNFAINILGAYVHTNRLQYVEFFGKFYEGGGRAFAPFSAKTKYYRIKEN